MTILEPQFGVSEGPGRGKITHSSFTTYTLAVLYFLAVETSTAGSLAPVSPKRVHFKGSAHYGADFPLPCQRG
jgi:hypothetical protein